MISKTMLRFQNTSLSVSLLLWALVVVVAGCPSPIQPPVSQETNKYVWADSVLASLNLESKVAQMMMVDVSSVGDISSLADRESFGRRMMHGRMGGIVLFAGNPLDYAPWMEWSHSNSDIPPFVALDAEWGAGFRLHNFTRFPNAMTIAASEDTNLAFQIGAQTAQQAKTIGISVLFAPVADVQTNPKNPVIGTRSYSDQPDSVAAYAGAFARGVRSKGLMPVAKHFPGHGDTKQDSHTSLPVSDRTDSAFINVDLLPFQALFADSLEALMSAHIIPQGHSFSDDVPSTLSHRILTELVRDSLNFDGLIFSDALNMAGVTSVGSDSDIAVRAVKAGIDVLLMPPHPDAAMDAIVQAVKKGDLSETRIDASVRRILRAKEDLGLHTQHAVTDLSTALELVTSSKTQQAAWFAARRSITLLKNQEVIPLKTGNQPITLITADYKSYENPLLAPANLFYTALLDRSQSPINHIQLDPRNAAATLARELGNLPSDRIVLFADYIGTTPISGWNRSDFLEGLASSTSRLIVAEMASPFVIPRTPLSVAAHIVGYDASLGVAQALADVLFGMWPAEGHLPVAVGASYPIGFGLTTTQRLPSLAREADAGMNASALQALDPLLQHAIDDKAFPAAALVVGRGNTIVKRADFGRFTYNSKHVLNEHDVFDMASLTKVIATTTAIMQLVEADSIDLDRPVADYLPEFAANGKGSVTIWDLLTHTGGLIPFRPFYALGVTSSSGIKDQILNDSLIYEPGTRSSYSDFGPITLAWMIERITGMSFDDYTQKNIFIPLSMFETGYKSVRQGPISNAVPTEADTYFRKRLLQGEVHDETAWVLGGTAGHAGLFSTANDLAKFAAMYANGGKVGDVQFLKPETIRKFTTRVNYFGDHTRALGWDTKSASGYSSAGQHFGPLSFGHTGFTGTSLWVDPDTGLYVILLTNRVYPTRDNRGHIPIRPAVADIAFSALKKDRIDRSTTE